MLIFVHRPKYASVHSFPIQRRLNASDDDANTVPQKILIKRLFHKVPNLVAETDRGFSIDDFTDLSGHFECQCGTYTPILWKLC